jgi:hypothetical protein
VRTIRNTQTHRPGKVHSFYMFQLAAFRVTTGCWVVTCAALNDCEIIFVHFLQVSKRCFAFCQTLKWKYSTCFCFFVFFIIILITNLCSVARLYSLSLWTFYCSAFRALQFLKRKHAAATGAALAFRTLVYPAWRCVGPLHYGNKWRGLSSLGM